MMSSWSLEVQFMKSIVLTSKILTSKISHYLVCIMMEILFLKLFLYFEK